MNMHPIGLREAATSTPKPRTNTPKSKPISSLIEDCLVAMAENDRCAKAEKVGNSKEAKASRKRLMEAGSAWNKCFDAIITATPSSAQEVGLMASHALTVCDWGGDEVIPYESWLALLRSFERYGTQQQRVSHCFPDPVLPLIERHREQQAAVEAGQSDEEMKILSEIANQTWWALLDTAPATRSGAVAWANYIADLEAQEACPTIRPGAEGKETNVALVALQRLMSLMEYGAEERVASIKPPSSDPALALSEQIVKLEARFNELDGAGPADGPAKWYHASEQEQVTDRLYILRDALTATQATSLAGAAAQLAQIFAICDSLNASVHDEARAAEGYRKVKRLLFSIASVLEGHIPPACAGSILQMDKHCDPWRTYQEDLGLAGLQA